ncbi:NADH-ubiquinone oxidoreductase-F iron-sulfur binding region domain-containing protein [Anoxybacter fermentans]|uniref:NADH-ubiquinone oxidoreductase-F iron-sulfur binding region domain-containing protein n=1 Tax=Anoxybacter fermentans TaxID=1323375 RepID=UPI0013E022C5
MTDRAQLLVCSGAACLSGRANEIKEVLKKELARHNLAFKYKIVETGCIGSCDLGPVMVVSPKGIFYHSLKPQDIKEIVENHFLGGQVVERLLYQVPEIEKKIQTINEIPFFKNQVKIALRNCGIIDPIKIEDYLSRGGYQALSKVLHEMTPEEVIEEIKISGLRGRGGGGFPTGIKWELARNSELKSEDDTKFVICNADEGDPGAFMDRGILEGDPHSVIEAMVIAGYVIGARQGYVYVRAEYPLAVERLEAAIKVARDYGALGKNIFDSGFDFDLEIRVGAGAFVCGEETALIHSVQGQRGEPRPKPPFPVTKGLWNKPTLINNVETLANIPAIILKGGKWYSQYGTKNSKGTKVFALAGDINNTGLIEVPMGTTLRTIVYELGGGIPDGKKFKAAQIGGPSGGVLSEEYLDIPLDYDSLSEIGAMVGSGGLVIMDENSCMVDIAKFYLDFTQDESCGKCTPCRVGTKRMLEILKRIVSGDGKKGDIEELEDLAKLIKETSLCGLGQTAPNPVLSTLKYFRDEYEAHIMDKYCPAGVCKFLMHYYIDLEKCIGCGICARVCPVEAITGVAKKPHTIDPEICKKCGLCYQKCPVNAISRGKGEAALIGGIR